MSLLLPIPSETIRYSLVAFATKNPSHPSFAHFLPSLFAQRLAQVSSYRRLYARVARFPPTKRGSYFRLMFFCFWNSFKLLGFLSAAYVVRSTVTIGFANFYPSLQWQRTSFAPRSRSAHFCSGFCRKGESETAFAALCQVR